MAERSGNPVPLWLGLVVLVGVVIFVIELVVVFGR